MYRSNKTPVQIKKTCLEIRTVVSYLKMIKKKMCLIGPFGVGKTSLIRKYVLNIYSEEYHSTVGVKIDKKNLKLETGEEIVLLIWDLEGNDDINVITESYLQGMSGYFLVADGTRPETLEIVASIRGHLTDRFPHAASTLLINKYDLAEEWAVNDADITPFTDKGISVLYSSAKTGSGVENAFIQIAHQMIANGDD